MRQLAEKQQQILDYLLERPAGATLEELAGHLGLTKSGAKEHVLKLESYGYLLHQDTRGAVGRPRRRYSLSAEGQEVFPRQYSWLSNVLLELLSEEMGPQTVLKILRALAKKVVGTMEPRFESARERGVFLDELTTVLNELGYRAALKQSDIRKGAVIEATNCVYHNVAKKHPQLCQFDVHFLQQASGMQVKLETCIARGGAVCRFCIRKDGSDQTETV